MFTTASPSRTRSELQGGDDCPLFKNNVPPNVKFAPTPPNLFQPIVFRIVIK